MDELRLVDAHCHVQAAQFSADRNAVLARARAAGCLCVVAGDTLAESEAACTLAAATPWCVACVGVHPANIDAEPWSVDQLRTLAARPHVVGIGETGLDYARTSDAAARARQRDAFAAQLALAAERSLPVVIHCRDAYEDVLAILREHPGSRFLMHTFVGTPQIAEQLLALGGFLSFSGIVTFKNARDVQASARMVPLDHLLVETDAPYLAPVPYRGQRNEPAWVATTIACIAALRMEKSEAVRTATVRNALRCFRLDALLRA